jgi:hypothetical protein
MENTVPSIIFRSVLPLFISPLLEWYIVFCKSSFFTNICQNSRLIDLHMWETTSNVPKEKASDTLQSRSSKCSLTNDHLQQMMTKEAHFQDKLTSTIYRTAESHLQLLVKHNTKQIKGAICHN